MSNQQLTENEKVIVGSGEWVRQHSGNGKTPLLSLVIAQGVKNINAVNMQRTQAIEGVEEALKAEGITGTIMYSEALNAMVLRIGAEAAIQVADIVAQATEEKILRGLDRATALETLGKLSGIGKTHRGTPEYTIDNGNYIARLSLGYRTANKYAPNEMLVMQPAIITALTALGIGCVVKDSLLGETIEINGEDNVNKFKAAWEEAKQQQRGAANAAASGFNR